MRFYPIGDTITALATPPGRGAISIVRLSGPAATAILQKITRNQSLPQPRKLTRMRIYNPDENLLLDDALVAFFPGPGSYTGEDMVELHLHGSPPIIEAILQTLHRLGARPAEPGEFTYRAFVHGKMDLTEAEAVNDLIMADSLWAARTALSQMEGHLKKMIESWRENLLELIARLEADVDFGDAEMMDFIAPDEIIQRCEHLLQELDHILQTYHTGRALKEGFRIVIVGRPNAGKSSLFNALLQTPRAIVTEIPGTTRDYLTERMILDGMTVELVDTAGMREDAEYIEKLGIEQTRRLLNEADLILWVVDRSVPVDSADSGIYREIRAFRFWLILNKIDLPPALDSRFLREHYNITQIFSISCKTGEGLDVLRDAIRQELAHYRRQAGDEPVLITSVRHRDALTQARLSLEQAIRLTGEGHPAPIILEELRSTLQQLDRITGKTDVEEILEHIFRNFCIGK